MTPQEADLDTALAETARPEGLDHFPKLQIIANCCLTTCIKPDHQTPHFWSCQSHHLLTPTRSLGHHYPRQIHPCLSVLRLQIQDSACGCASTYENDDHHRNIKARAVGRQARPLDHPDLPDPSTSRDPQHWAGNCPPQKPTDDHEPQTHDLSCEYRPIFVVLSSRCDSNNVYFKFLRSKFWIFMIYSFRYNRL